MSSSSSASAMDMIPSDPLSFAFWRDRVIEEGIASVRAHERAGPRQRGGLRGFELCRTLDSLAAFARELHELRAAEFFLSDGVYLSTVAADRYWEHRYTTLQVEHVYERMRVMCHFFGVRESE